MHIYTHIKSDFATLVSDRLQKLTLSITNYSMPTDTVMKVQQSNRVDNFQELHLLSILLHLNIFTFIYYYKYRKARSTDNIS